MVGAAVRGLGVVWCVVGGDGACSRRHGNDEADGTVVRPWVNFR